MSWLRLCLLSSWYSSWNNCDGTWPLAASSITVEYQGIHLRLTKAWWGAGRIGR